MLWPGRGAWKSAGGRATLGSRNPFPVSDQEKLKFITSSQARSEEDFYIFTFSLQLGIVNTTAAPVVNLFSQRNFFLSIISLDILAILFS